jgi:hypothetical protein
LSRFVWRKVQNLSFVPYANLPSASLFVSPLGVRCHNPF